MSPLAVPGRLWLGNVDLTQLIKLNSGHSMDNFLSKMARPVEVPL